MSSSEAKEQAAASRPVNYLKSLIHIIQKQCAQWTEDKGCKIYSSSSSAAPPLAVERLSVVEVDKESLRVLRSRL